MTAEDHKAVIRRLVAGEMDVVGHAVSPKRGFSEFHVPDIRATRGKAVLVMGNAVEVKAVERGRIHFSARARNIPFTYVVIGRKER